MTCLFHTSLVRKDQILLHLTIATGSVQLIVKGLDIRDHTISTIKQNNSYLKIVDRKKVIVFNL